MRYGVMISLDKDEIPKDKNRMILSYIKHHLNALDNDFFESLYADGETNRKDFTFSLYMGDCEFKRDVIKIPKKQIYLNFSTYNLLAAIEFYNAITRGLNKKYIYKGIGMTAEKIQPKQEVIFKEDKAIFKTLSPCVVRQHNQITNKDWFHSLDTDKGQKIFLENLKYQLLNSIAESEYDIDDIEISVIKNKEVKVKHYDIEVLSNLCVFEMHAKPYILDYFYNAGVGSFKSTGFGMLSK